MFPEIKTNKGSTEVEASRDMLTWGLRIKNIQNHIEPQEMRATVTVSEADSINNNDIETDR